MIREIFILAACWSAACVEASDLLPQPAKVSIEFDRDVRPIFEARCFRCHGAETQKSDFQLTSRADALQGGDDNTNDIVPGHSDRSPLIRYVAGLDPEIEMPPPDSGVPPLTPAQIGVLRAWIDQGVVWGTNATLPALSLAISPTLRWIGVQGSRGKFREVEGTREGWGGGADNFSLVERTTRGQKFTLAGHALFPDHDFKLTLGWTKNNLGFVRSGVEEWRRYYDDRGGRYPPFTPSSFSLNRDLYLDIGRAWVDFGLVRPHWPRLVLGYEYQFRRGAKSTLAWGPVTQNGETKNIAPSAEDIDEHTHIFKADITENWRGWALEGRSRFELYQLGDSRESAVGQPGTIALQRVNQSVHYTRGANSFGIARQLTRWWRLSAGGLYSRSDGGSHLNQNGVNAYGAPTLSRITLERDSRVMSLSTLLSPAKGLSLSGAGQAEWTHEKSFGDTALNIPNPTAPGTFISFPGTVKADQNQTELSEILEARFNRVPRTVVFAEARLQQDSVWQSEMADNDFDPTEQRADSCHHLWDARAGFTSSPWSWLEWGAHVRRHDSSTGYNNLAAPAGSGYPGFITHRDIAMDEIAGRVTLHPVLWLTARLTYRWDRSEYSSATRAVDSGAASPGGPVQDGRTESHNFGTSLTFTPVQRLYCAGSFTYGYSRTTTTPAASPEVVPYAGNTFTVTASAGYALNWKTELNVSYTLSQAGYGQNNTAGVPLGLNFTRHELLAGVTRQMTPNVSGTLRYQFSQYVEPGSGGVNDFSAHGIFVTLSCTWP